jgi:hypothetical protein
MSSTTHPLAANLGRLHLPDARDANYPLARLAATTPIPPAPKTGRKVWTPGPLLDQGQTPDCVGYSGRNLLAAMPTPIRTKTPTGPTIYRGAQRYDGIPGRHDGSDDHGSMKYLQTRGLISAYYWPANADEARDYVWWMGPVLFGTSWTNDMFDPDSRGFVHPTGAVAGGHEYCAIGFDADLDAYICYQTWGQWGTVPNEPGWFYVARRDAESLRAEQGDICAPTKTAKG